MVHNRSINHQLEPWNRLLERLVSNDSQPIITVITTVTIIIIIIILLLLV